MLEGLDEAILTSDDIFGQHQEIVDLEEGLYENILGGV